MYKMYKICMMAFTKCAVFDLAPAYVIPWTSVDLSTYQTWYLKHLFATNPLFLNRNGGRKPFTLPSGYDYIAMENHHFWLIGKPSWAIYTMPMLNNHSHYIPHPNSGISVDHGEIHRSQQIHSQKSWLAPASPLALHPLGPSPHQLT